MTPLIRPGTEFGDRRKQIDFRVGRTFRSGSLRFDPFVDFYNLFDAATIMSQNNTYGPAWQNPTDVLIGRVIQVGLQFDF